MSKKKAGPESQSAGEVVSFHMTDAQAGILWAYAEACGLPPSGETVKTLVFDLINEPFEDPAEENLAASGVAQIVDWVLKNPGKVDTIKNAALRYVMGKILRK